MENYQLIQDTGLFVGKKLFNFSLDESLESIEILFQTIKEYREFTRPDDAGWLDYIHQIFHLFGFNTEIIAPGLITLQEMGTNLNAKALVGIISPKDNYDQIISNVEWKIKLFNAAKSHQVEWVIMTNGLLFKVLNYKNGAVSQKYFICELDEIIRNNQTDSFFTLYKVIQVINGRNLDKISNRDLKEKQIENNKDDDDAYKPVPKGNRVFLKCHVIRREFWTQLVSRTQGKTALFSKTAPGVERYLNISAGKRGLLLNYIIITKDARVELTINSRDKYWNKKIFNSLFLNKQEIERVFGEPLSWEIQDDQRGSIIRSYITGSGLADENNWPELQDKMIEAMIRFEKAFRPFIKQLD